ncbi:MAG: 4Fe-4S binding protein [Methanomicrobium sp.]|nr:4Fe-4S binding protein [Methanomicrobium sp.]
MKVKLAISKPTVGASGKTGSWRTFRPVVSHETCTKCGNCYRFCPDAAIDTEFNIDYDFCKGCGICVEVCPKSCIRLIREDE